MTDRTPAPLRVVDTDDGTRLTVRVIPRAGRSAVAGIRDGALLCRVAAAPVDGAANDSLLKLLARSLSVPRHRLTLSGGARARDKVILIAGLSASEVRARLDDAC